MRITHITHASILINANNRTILSDPWWQGPCFGAQWWNYPPPCLAPLENEKIDFIYISHGHNDHFHPGTLKTLNKEATVLVSSHINLADGIRELGFNVVELENDNSFDLGQGVTVSINQTYGADTYFTVSDGLEVCVNLNDSLHSSPLSIQKSFCRKISAAHPRVDYLFCGYGVASHFPNCYRIPGKNYEETASRRQRYFNRRWSEIVKEINPRFGFPFAADVAFLDEELFWSNAPTHNSERPTAVFRRLQPYATTTVIDIAPGFTIDNGSVIDDIQATALAPDWLAETYKDKIQRANRHGEVNRESSDNALELTRQNVEFCRSYLETFPYDYHFLIRFHNSRNGIAIRKTGSSITVDRVETSNVKPRDAQYDVVFSTRLPYLRWSLTKKYGHEILFVGSGGIFSFESRSGVQRQLHVEFRHILRKHDSVPARKKPERDGVLLKSKNLIKRILGVADEDLYDLDQWTVYRSGDENEQSSSTISADEVDVRGGV